MLHWPQTTFEFSKFYISLSYHHLQRPRCHLHVANRINFFVIFWNGKWEKMIFCTIHGVPAVCTHCHMTGMPWFMSCGSIYATPCQEWLLGLKAHKSTASRSIRTDICNSGINTELSLVLEKESLHKKKCHRGICGEEHCQLVSLDQRGGGGKLEWITFRCFEISIGK